MSGTADVLVIGGGINGLVCAAYLAKAGRKPLVLEALDTVGGCARTSEIAPGFRVPTLAHSAGPLRADVVAELSLARHGLQWIATPTRYTALNGRTAPLAVYDDVGRTCESLKASGVRDAERWPQFSASLSAIGGVLGTLLQSTPPDVDGPGARDLMSALRTLRAFRALPKADAYRLLRWGPMAVADLVGESLDDERLRAAVAVDGVFGTRFGPWSAGSGMVLLLAAANESIGTKTRVAQGGPGAIAAAVERALIALGGRVEINATVERILVDQGRAVGVRLRDGRELRAGAIVSGVDPKRTFLQLCDPIDLAPEFLWRMRNFRTAGTVAKVNLALSSLPSFDGVTGDALGSRIRVAPDLDYLERAFDHSKYGRYSPEPLVEIAIPSVLDPSLAPSGAHVLSAYVQFAPHALRNKTWDEERDGLLRVTVSTLDRYAPGLAASVVAAEVITPLDLEQRYGLTGGHIFHGELALDQLLEMRPLHGWGRYRSPIANLFLCGSGTHPGTGLTGGSGANAAREILRALRS